MKTTLKSITSFSKQLILILEQEYDILKQQDYEQLVSITNEKQMLVKQMEVLDQQRQKLSAHFTSFSEYLNHHLDAVSLKNDWDIILQNLKTCKEKNEVNGRLLQKKQQLSSDLLNLLSGNKNSAPATYGADGLQQNSTSILNNTQA